MKTIYFTYQAILYFFLLQSVFFTFPLLKIEAKPVEAHAFKTKKTTTIEIDRELVRKKIYSNGNHDKHGEHRIGITAQQRIDILKSGTQYTVADKGMLYRLEIYSKGAKALLLTLSPLRLTEGCRLYLMNTKHDTVGPYGAKETVSGRLTTAALLGNRLTIELWVPSEANPPKAIIEHIGHCYKTPLQFKSSLTKSTLHQSECTQENIETYPMWLREGRSVVRLYGITIGQEPPFDVYDTGGTGFLISNQKDYDDIGDICQEDAVKPRLFLLTACHIIDYENDHDVDETDILGLYKMNFYFNDLSHRNDNYFVSTGANLLHYRLWERTFGECADYGYYDYALLELKNAKQIYSRAAPYLAGVQLAFDKDHGIVNIHHPENKTKKYNYEDLPAFGPYCKDIRAYWQPGQHTEPGSSGSPFFDAKTKRCVGVLKWVMSISGDCSYNAYATNLSRAWETGLAAFLDSPKSPISGGFIPGIDTQPIQIDDFTTLNGGEHFWASTKAIRFGLRTRFNKADAELRAREITYSQEMDPLAPTAALSFWNDSDVEIHTNYLNLPVMTIGDPYSYMSDQTRVRIYVCESEPIENYEIHAMRKVEIKAQTRIQIGKRVNAVSPQAITYQPWAKLTIDAPEIEINQPIAAKFLLPQQQEEFDGYVRLVSQQDGLIGNSNIAAIDIHTLNAVSLGGLNMQAQNTTFWLYKSGNLNVEAMNNLFFTNTTIQSCEEPLVHSRPGLAIRGHHFSANALDIIKGDQWHIDFYGGVTGSHVEIFEPPVRVPYPYYQQQGIDSTKAAALHKASLSGATKQSPALQKITPLAAMSRANNDFLYLTAKSWNLDKINIKAINQSQILVQAENVHLGLESEINTNGSIAQKDGAVVLRALSAAESGRFSAELENQVKARLSAYSIKNNPQQCGAGATDPSYAERSSDAENAGQEKQREAVDQEHCPANKAEDIKQINCFAYPNPFNPTSKIEFHLPNDAHVRIDVFNMLGQQIEQLVNRTYTAGRHQARWQAQSRPSGMYFCVIQIKPGNETPAIRKILKLALVK